MKLLLVSIAAHEKQQTSHLENGPKKDSRLNFLPYKDYTEDHIALMKKNAMPLLTRPPLPGTNTIIIGHDDPFEAATGIYPEPQGIAFILQPDGGKSFKIIGSVLPSEWATL